MPTDLRPDEDYLGPSAAGSATSENAAWKNLPKSGTQRRVVFDLIVEAGEEGMTRDELVQATGRPVNSVTPRVWELQDGGWVRETSKTRTTSHGSQGAVLVATTREKEATKPKTSSQGVDKILDGWRRKDDAAILARGLLKAAEEKGLSSLKGVGSLVEEKLLYGNATCTDLGLAVARKLWYQRRDGIGYFKIGDVVCRYPKHRTSDWIGDGGRMVCGVCHPRPKT